MVVKVSISADSSGATKALQDVQGAATGARDAGRDFSKIDFSHPELADVAANLERVRENFEKLLRLGRGETAQAVRRVVSDGQGGDSLFGKGGIIDAAGSTFTSSAQSRRVMDQAREFLLRGTSADPSHVFGPPRPPPPPPSVAPAPAPTPIQPPGQPASPLPGMPPKTVPSGVENGRFPTSFDTPPRMQPGGDTGGGGFGQNGNGRATFGQNGALGEAAEAGGGGALIGSLFEGAIGVAGLLAGPAKALLGMAGVGGGIGAMAGKALNLGQNESIANDSLYRSMDGRADSFDKLDEAVKRATDGLGMTYQESQRLAAGMVRISGAMPQAYLESELKTGVSFARGYGIDAGDAVQTMTRMSTLDGYSRANVPGGEMAGDSRSHMQAQAELIAEATRAGGMSGQTDQVMHSILRWSEAQSRMTVGGSNNEGFAAMYAGMNATKVAGMTDSAAEALISRVDGAVRQGGAGGQGSQVLTAQAFMGAGVTDPYEMEYDLSKGMFAKVGRHGETTYQLMADKVAQQTGGKTLANGKTNYKYLYAMGQQFGITPSQAEGLSMVKPADLNAGHEAFQRMGIDINKLDPSSYQDDFRLATEDDGEVQRDRTRMLGEGGRLHGKVSADEATELGTLSGDPLRKRMIELSGKYGMEETKGSETLAAQAKLNNAMTDLGQHLEGIVTPITSFVATIGEGMNDLIKITKKLFEKSDTSVDQGATVDPTPTPPAGGLLDAAGLMTISYHGGQVGMNSGVFHPSGGAFQPSGPGFGTPSGAAAMDSPVDRSNLPASMGGDGANMSSKGWRNASAEVRAATEQAAAEKGVPAELLGSLFQHESSFEAGQITEGGGGHGARGLGQLRDSSGTRLTPEERLNPFKNARDSAALLRSLYDKFGNWKQALEAYNQGPSLEKMGNATGYANRILRDAHNYAGDDQMAGGPTGTAIPRGAVAGGGDGTSSPAPGQIGPGGGIGMVHHIRAEPLEVIHRDSTGRTLGRDYVPMTQVGPAQPWGGRA